MRYVVTHWICGCMCAVSFLLFFFFYRNTTHMEFTQHVDQMIATWLSRVVFCVASYSLQCRHTYAQIYIYTICVYCTQKDSGLFKFYYIHFWISFLARNKTECVHSILVCTHISRECVCLHIYFGLLQINK